MALILEEIIKLPILSSFQLAAGKGGLRRTVRGMGILDHEYVDLRQEPLEADEIFAPGSFVLASLLFAKDEPGKILPAFKQLLIDGCCAVAVKKVYYQELPREVLDFANDENFPVFMYSSYEKMFTELNGKGLQGYLFFPYRRGVLTVISEQAAPADGWRREIPHHVTGSSNSCSKWVEFPYAAIEAISASKYAQMYQLPRKAYSELGIYKMLLPDQNNYWLSLLCKDMAGKIQNADPTGELWETAVEYINQGMDVNQTSKALILHNNTVRYRIAKLAKLMGYAEAKLEFRTVLYLVVKKTLCDL